MCTVPVVTAELTYDSQMDQVVLGRMRRNLAFVQTLVRLHHVPYNQVPLLFRKINRVRICTRLALCYAWTFQGAERMWSMFQSQGEINGRKWFCNGYYKARTQNSRKHSETYFNIQGNEEIGKMYSDWNFSWRWENQEINFSITFLLLLHTNCRRQKTNSLTYRL